MALKLYEISQMTDLEELSTGDMLLDSIDSQPQFYYVNVIEKDDEVINLEKAELYGIEIIKDICFLPVLKDTLVDLVNNDSPVSICLGNLTDWMLGINKDGNRIEEMYADESVTMLKELIFELSAKSDIHDIRMICSDYLLQYIVDILHSKNYIIE